MRIYAQPFLLEVDNCQTLLSCLDVSRQGGFAVVLKDSRLQFWIGVGSSQPHVVQSSFPVNRWRWLKIQFSCSQKTFKASVQQLNRLAEPTPKPEVIVESLPAPMVCEPGPMLFGAGLFEDVGRGSPKPACFFNGRLDSPELEIMQPQRRLLARYDFTQEMSKDVMVDVSGNRRHGILFNAPTRAVKGHNWDGSEVDWTKNSQTYGAIHLHEDDLDDAGWDTDFQLTIPASCRSGAYAVEIKTSDQTRDMVTFFVRPNPSSTAQIALVLPTFTYMAYANEHMFDQTKASAMAVPDHLDIRSEDENFKKMKTRSDLGLSVYDVHRDGTGCVFTSYRRPILNIRPGYMHWALHRPREFSADLLMIGFLEQLGIPYDVITDHCLHLRGNAAVSQYSTLITGCHPEYCSLQMLDTYVGFAKSGGNIMYLGGNGFYWVTEADSDHPHRVEVRKGDQGCRSITIPPGERFHSTGGAHGGLWRSRGRAPNYLFGIGSCAFGTGKGKPYVQNVEQADNAIFTKVFAGIKPGELIGVEGFGGGASGDEIDRLDYELGSPSNTVLLATSQTHDDSFGLFNEEQMWPMVNTLGSNCDRVRSDMTYSETAGGGAVFAVGSINWYSSLGWDNYQNNVARVSENVLREFHRRGRGRG